MRVVCVCFPLDEEEQRVVVVAGVVVVHHWCVRSVVLSGSRAARYLLGEETVNLPLSDSFLRCCYPGRVNKTIKAQVPRCRRDFA